MQSNLPKKDVSPMHTAAPAQDMSSAFSPSAWEVLRHRYLRKDQHGAVAETPEEMFRRVAHTVAE
jgi:ribonucleoside-diphosphate reductase alpha chain